MSAEREIFKKAQNLISEAEGLLEQMVDEFFKEHKDVKELQWFPIEGHGNFSVRIKHEWYLVCEIEEPKLQKCVQAMQDVFNKFVGINSEQIRWFNV